MPDYYQQNHIRYYEQTVSIDPGSFLSPLAGCLKPGSTVLDVGCGSGRDLRWFRERGFAPTGFERSRGLAALARKHSECPVLEGDYEWFDFSETAADALVLVGALVHVPHIPFESVFRNILRALKPGGHVLITLKEGRTESEEVGSRSFYLWQDEDSGEIFSKLGLEVIDFSRQTSKIRETDVWLGYGAPYGLGR